jgi:hypothetical protein
MALAIPIISTFDGKGISKAVNEFKNLEGASKKAQFAIKKAAVPAGLALAGLGAALFDATKGAMEDSAAQDKLAGVLQRVTGATDKQIKANEDFITKQGKLLGITDDELRPALGRLATATGSVTKAQELATAAMDIAAATGKPLEAVISAVEKAYGGNTAALAKLAPEVRKMIKDGASFEEVMKELAKTTGGAATDAANTAAGKFKTLKTSLDETKESIGAALLPAVEKVLPYLQKMADWASDNPDKFLIIAGTIGAIAAAVLVANTAMKVYTAGTIIATAAQAAFNAVMSANPIALIVLGIAALIAGLILAYKNFEGLRNIVDSVGRGLKTGFIAVVDTAKASATTLGTAFKTAFKGIAEDWNNTVGKLSFTVPSWVPKIGGKGFDVPDIPMLAAGGIVTGPTLALIGERGPEAVIPLSGPNAGGGMGMGGNNVTINVNGGDPQSVVNALRTYMRQNGSVPIRVSNIF